MHSSALDSASNSKSETFRVPPSIRTMSRHSGFQTPPVAIAIRAQSMSWFQRRSLRRSLTRVPTAFILLSTVRSWGVPRGIKLIRSERWPIMAERSLEKTTKW